ncbi:unnamed protein product [Moneuplotes crassus]|uniref:Uncharacterized protein n=1 Tax=Euplotes crassus TaxID=5936 RepID=A0AAD1UEA5_EUPCR|nr:unnamed protein product [Moneuplotes crassus]
MCGNEWSDNSWPIDRKYYLHSFCFCGYQDNQPFLQDIPALYMPEIPTPLSGYFMGVNQRQSQEETGVKLNRDPVNDERQNFLDNKAFNKFLSEQVAQSSSLQVYPSFDFNKKKMKKIERDFTNLNSRKDVVYKAVLRFFRRTCQMQIKQMKCSKCTYQLDSEHPCCHTGEKARMFLKSVLGIPTTPELVEIFRVIVSFGSLYDSSESPAYEFTNPFKACMGKFNRKKLHKIISNKYFASIFVKFWQRPELFQNMVRSLNSKRAQLINEEAHRYYLQKLIHSCMETLQR